MRAFAGRGGRRLIPVIAICMAAIPAGCAEWMPRTGANAQLPALEYYAWLKSAPEGEVEAEQARLMRTGAGADSAVRRASLALLLSVPRTTGSNEVHARELLNNLETATGSNETGFDRDFLRLGSLWRDVLTERDRLQQAATDIGRELEIQHNRARALQEENRALRRQIDELKSIEQKINQRGQPRGN